MKNINVSILFTIFMLAVHSVFASSSSAQTGFSIRIHPNTDLKLDLAVQAGNLQQIQDRLSCFPVWEDKVLDNALERFDNPAMFYPNTFSMPFEQREQLKAQIKGLFAPYWMRWE